MPSAGSTSTGKLALLAALYLAQGVPFGFFTQVLPVVMRKEGLSLPAIGLSSMLAVPWAVKFLWAPLVDRYGERTRWIVALQTAAALLAAATAFLDSQSAVPVLIVAVLLANLFAATQDVATDGLAVDVLNERERGLGNGVQVAGYRAGMAVGGGLLVVVFDRAGWSTTFLAMAAILALLVVPALMVREPLRRPPTTTAARVSMASWIDVARRPRMTAWLCAIAAYKMFDAMSEGMVRPFLVDQGVSLTRIGVVVGTVGFTASLVGALCGGFIAGKVSRRASLWTGGGAEALMITAWLLPALGVVTGDAIGAVVVLEHFAGGMSTAAIFTLMMDACDPRTGATDYTLQASVVVVASFVGITASGLIAEHLGYAVQFGVAAAGFALCFFVVAALVARGALPPEVPS